MHLLSLLATRRFLPLFLTQFLGAFNDNAFKNALVILITYRTAAEAGYDAGIMVTLALGLLLLPYVFFSATAGALADRFEKAALVCRLKELEIALMGLAGLGFAIGNVWLLMAVLFGMGLQSTLFSPIKWGILPEYLKREELIDGNALIEAGSYLAILVGMIVGNHLILVPGGEWATTGLLVGLAALGWVAARFMPKAGPTAPGLRIDRNILGASVAILRHSRGNRDIWLSILGISWFWTIGAMVTAQAPTLAKEVMQADETVVTLLLVVLCMGIGFGSILCTRALKGDISARYLPFAAALISLFAIDTAFAAQTVTGGAPGALIGVEAFLGQIAGWRVLIDFLGVAAAGGFFSVPLYAIVQVESADDHRARNIAANNIMNALFIVVASLGAMAMLAAGLAVTDIFLALGAINVGVALYIVGLLPRQTIRAIVRWVFRLFYRVEVRGLENVPPPERRLVVVVNHVSFLDGLMIAAFLPGWYEFAINTQMARKWYIAPFVKMFGLLPVDATNPMAAKTLARAVQAGRRCVIFPEGRLTTTGALMKVYTGPAAIADIAGAAVLPVRIDGLQYTGWSRMLGKVRRRRFPKTSVTVLPPRRLAVPDELRGRRRRAALADRLYDVMAEMMFETSDRDKTLFAALLDARAIHGRTAPIIEDLQRAPASYDRVVTGAFALGRQFARLSAPGERVGVLLPTANAGVVTFFALQAYGRVPAMLNFSVGAASLTSAIETATVRTVITSRTFIERARLHALETELAGQVQLVYLEELRDAIRPGAKLLAWLQSRFGAVAYRLAARRATPADPAAVLFTSGSEGAPKGVVLTHANLQAVRFQLASRIDFNPSDTVLNALPLFHSFGLVGGMLLPLLSGVRAFHYPSPLHYRIVPELAYDRNATILFGTDTFLAGYGRLANPYDFYAVRYVFAGAERLKDETRRLWTDKFGLRILEGYGATETSAVCALNTPMHCRPGTVGRLLPGMQSRVEPVEGIETGGRLWVHGPNIMAGYLRADAPGRLDPPADGWYDTGDIVEIDVDGYIAIRGRAKRFAKIGGEMVSLTAVERLVGELWPDAVHAVVAVADPRKGEQLVLVTTQANAERDRLSDHIRRSGATELSVPRSIVTVTEMPLLATGKADYPAIEKLANTGDETLANTAAQPIATT